MQTNPKRKTRKEKYALQQQMAKNKRLTLNWRKIALTILLIGGLILTLSQISFYQETIIDWRISTSIWFLGGILLMPISIRFLHKYFDTNDIMSRLVFSICVLGGIAGYIFIATNYYFHSDSQLQTIRTNILKTGKSYNHKFRSICRHSYAEVEINGIDKTLNFPCTFEIEKYNYVTITIQKGIWGFGIIKEKTATIE